MPYFKWRSVDLQGKLSKGYGKFLSKQELDAYLFNRDCALLRAVQVDHWSFINSITTSMKISCFRHLALLLRAGVFLDQALILVKQQCGHKPLSEVLDDIHLAVIRGSSLADALSMYYSLFDSVTLTLVYAGQEAGNLASMLTLLADHHEAVEQFYKKMRHAIALPLLTLLFFLGVSALLVAYVVPLCATMFASAGKSMPTSTAWLMVLHSWLTWHMLFIASGLIGFAFFLQNRWRRSSRIKGYIDAFVLRIPIIGTLINRTMVMYCLQTLSILHAHGIALLPALHALSVGMNNQVIKKKLALVENGINEGRPLDEAFQGAHPFIMSTAYQLLAIGQQSGDLAGALASCADLYKHNIQRQLVFITVVIQPLLMIVLGLLVVGLIVAIYMPIIQLSDAIT